ncbi:MAG: hypothetical protein RL643_228, partial [Actinomycetota bacterium]
GERVQVLETHHPGADHGVTKSRTVLFVVR